MLLVSREYALSTSLLNSMAPMLEQLPRPQRQSLHQALVSDKENIQQVQTYVLELSQQLQQLQQQVQEHLLSYVGHTKVLSSTDTTSSNTESTSPIPFLTDIKKQLAEAVQVREGVMSADTTIAGFYSGMLLQANLYQAQAALTQGDWAGYQNSLQQAQAVLALLHPLIFLIGWYSKNNCKIKCNILYLGR